MSKELVISSNRHETKVAILEDDQLVEIYFQRQNEYSLAGSIHKGRVTRVLPGMQSAFVDLGLERDTFLYVSDFFEENEDIDRIPGGTEDRVSRERGERPERPERIERPPAIVREPPAPVVVVEPEEQPAAVAAPPEAAGPNRPERNEEFDRRGRRSRRRRNRGRGFPDSKYAPADEPVPQRPPQRPAMLEPMTEPVSLDDFAVLPGESLAKYSGRPPGEEPEADDRFALTKRSSPMPASRSRKRLPTTLRASRSRRTSPSSRMTGPRSCRRPTRFPMLPSIRFRNRS